MYTYAELSERLLGQGWTGAEIEALAMVYNRLIQDTADVAGGGLESGCDGNITVILNTHTRGQMCAMMVLWVAAELERSKRKELARIWLNYTRQLLRDLDE